MPEVEILIGGRSFSVACQEGEEQYLYSAAHILDGEAQVLVDQIGRMPESRLLLMAGLMLADKTGGLEDKLKAADAELATARKMIGDLENRPAPDPERVEVPVLPAGVSETMAEIAARTEALATELEEKAG